MEKYVIPRNRRRRIVVSDNLHEEVSAYAVWGSFHLLRQHTASSSWGSFRSMICGSMTKRRYNYD